MNKRICILFISLLFFTYMPASAHKDRVITLENGKLTGLPEKYQPAYLNLDEKYLQIGENRFDFPPCVAKYIPNEKKFSIEITSSWYHDISILPPYIAFSIKPEGENYWFHLIFNLDTLEPIEFQIRIQESDTSISHHPLKTDGNCRESIKNSYTKIK